MKQSSIETKMIFNPKLEHLQHGGWKFKPFDFKNDYTYQLILNYVHFDN